MSDNYVNHYAKWHDGSDQDYGKYHELYSKLLKKVLNRVDAKARVMDIGCGTGLLVSSLRANGYSSVIGVDIDIGQIRLAEMRGLPCVHVDKSYIFEMSYREPSSLDVVFLMDVLEHMEVEEQIPFLSAVAKIVKPGGILVMSVPNANSSFAMRWRHIDWTHRDSFTEHSIEFAINAAGFSAMTIHPFEFGRKPRFPYVHRPANWLFLIRSIFRGFRRLEAIAELGKEGFVVPLGLNLLVEARR